MNRSLKLLAAAPLVALPLLMGGTASAATPTTGPKPPDPQALLQCLRDHGVDVPAAPADGGPIVIEADAGDTAKLDALKACGPDVPPPGTPGTVKAVDPDELKPFAQCMREHGLPDFPEPGEQGLVVPDGSDLRPGDADFDAAQKACKDQLPAPSVGGEAGEGPVLVQSGGAAGGDGPVAVGTGGAAAAGSALAITVPGKPAGAGGVVVKIHQAERG